MKVLASYASLLVLLVTQAYGNIHVIFYCDNNQYKQICPSNSCDFKDMVIDEEKVTADKFFNNFKLGDEIDKCGDGVGGTVCKTKLRNGTCDGLCGDLQVLCEMNNGQWN